jgi:hypothetical protein
MAFINKILQFVLGISLLLLVYAMVITGTFSSSQKLTEVLNQSGFYDSLAKGLSNQLKAQVIGTDTTTNIVKAGIGQGITPDLVRALMQPSQIAVVDWLNKGTGSLDVRFDMETVKDKISSKVDDPKARFEIVKLLPDTIIIIDAGKKDNSVLAGIERFKLAYSYIKLSIPFLWGAVFGSALVLFAINLRGGSKKLTRIFYAVMFGSVIGIALAMIFRYVAGGINLSITDSQSLLDVTLITKIVITVISQTLPVFIFMGASGLAGVFIAKLVFLSKDKKIKHKRK